jgi:hypothetical protein
MKLKLALLLALITSAGLIAQDAKPAVPKGDEPGKKAEGKKADKGGKKPQPKPDSVDEATWKKFLAARKAASEDAAVKAAFAKVKPVAKDASEEEKKAGGAARKELDEAVKAAILKADASLESVFKAIEEGRAKGKGKGKGDKGGKKPEGEGKKPEAK